MIQVKHVKWEIGDDKSDMECTYTQDTVFSYRYKMLENRDLINMHSKDVYHPIKFKVREYQDILGIKVVESSGLYEVKEEDLE